MFRRTAALTCGVLVLPAFLTSTAVQALPAAAVTHTVAAAAPSGIVPARAAASTSTTSTKGTSSRAAAKKAAAKKAAAKKAAANKAAAKKAAAKKATKTTSTRRPTPTRTPVRRATDLTPFVSRVVAGAAPVTDAAGRTWAHRTAGWGSWKSGSVPPSTDVARTADDALYRKTAPGTRWYRLVVPGKATYRVRLLLTESWFTKPGQRVFDVRAEGKVVARRVDVVKAVGRNTAYDLTLTVPVSDGRLDLQFDALVDQPILSAVEVVSLSPVPRVPNPAPAVALSPDSFFFRDISAAPLAPNSARVAANLAAQVRDNWGGTAAFNAYRFNNSFYEVPPSQRKVRVNFYDCQRKGHTPAGLYDGAKHFVDVPIPDDAVPATGTDKQLTIYDRNADKLWDFWVTEKQANGSWRACWGGRIDDVSKNQGQFPAWFGASASGLAMTPGVITVDEFRRGRIDHAMYLAVIDAATWSSFSWPANRSDGVSRNPDAVMEGQRIRLDPTLDLTTIPMTPVARMIAEAAQKYGFVVCDKAGAVAVVTESGNKEKRRTGTNPWDGLLAGPDYQAMQGFPWSHVQVLPKDYGKPVR